MAVTRRLKTTEVAPVRVKLLAHQGGKCALCGKKIKTGALDHNHDTGYIRAVLCMACNWGEGKVRGALVRFSGELGSAWLPLLVAYWKKHEKPLYPLLHPTHKTEEEKRIAKNLKAKKTRAKRKAALAQKH